MRALACWRTAICPAWFRAGALPLVARTATTPTWREQRRSISVHPEPVYRWSKPEIEETVYNIILDNVKVPEDKVTMDSNFVYDLLLDKQHRYGILEDMHVLFRINLDEQVEATRQFHSGREMAAWLTGRFEQTGQLVY